MAARARAGRPATAVGIAQDPEVEAARLATELMLLAALPLALALAELMLIMLLEEAAAELADEREVVDLDAAEVKDCPVRVPEVEIVVVTATVFKPEVEAEAFKQELEAPAWITTGAEYAMLPWESVNLRVMFNPAGRLTVQT